jgi:hypothetical protein
MYTISLLNKLKKINLTQSLQTNPSRKKQKKNLQQKSLFTKNKNQIIVFFNQINYFRSNMFPNVTGI